MTRSRSFSTSDTPVMMEAARPRFTGRSTIVSDLNPSIDRRYARTRATSVSSGPAGAASEKANRSVSRASGDACSASTVLVKCASRRYVKIETAAGPAAMLGIGGGPVDSPASIPGDPDLREQHVEVQQHQ